MYTFATAEPVDRSIGLITIISRSRTERLQAALLEPICDAAAAGVVSSIPTTASIHLSAADGGIGNRATTIIKAVIGVRPAAGQIGKQRIETGIKLSSLK